MDPMFVGMVLVVAIASTADMLTGDIVIGCTCTCPHQSNKLVCLCDHISRLSCAPFCSSSTRKSSFSGANVYFVLELVAVHYVLSLILLGSYMYFSVHSAAEKNVA